MFRHLRQRAGDPRASRKLRIVELCWKRKQRVTLDDYSQVVARFSVLREYFAQLREVEGQILAQSVIIQYYKYLSEKLLIVANWSFISLLPSQLRSVRRLNRIVSCFGIFIEYLWREASRKETTSASREIIARGQTGSMTAWLTTEKRQRNPINSIMWRRSQILGVRTWGLLRTGQLSHCTVGKYDGRPSSTSDGLGKVRMQCLRSDVVISWFKAHIVSPFQSMLASHVAFDFGGKKTTGGCCRYDVIALGPDLFRSSFCHKLYKGSGISSARLTPRSAQLFGDHFLKCSSRGIASPPLALIQRRGLIRTFGGWSVVGEGSVSTRQWYSLHYKQYSTRLPAMLGFLPAITASAEKMIATPVMG